MNYFVLDSSHIVQGYVTLSDELKDLSLHCSSSEFQYLTKDTREVLLKDKTGTVWPDFINEKGIPLVSKKMKDFLLKNGLDYLFYKKILLKTDRNSDGHEYWLALPARISCLNLEDTVIDDLFGTVEHFVINDKKVGRYEMFKLDGVTNLEIIITESLANKINEQDFVGVHILNLK